MADPLLEVAQIVTGGSCIGCGLCRSIVGAPPESLPNGVETDPIWGPAMPTMRAIADLGR